MGVLKHSDLFLANRGGKSYRAQVAQMKEYFGKGVLVDGEIEPEVSVFSPADGAGLGPENRYLVSDVITDVEGAGVLTCETELIKNVSTLENTTYDIIDSSSNILTGDFSQDRSDILNYDATSFPVLETVDIGTRPTPAIAIGVGPWVGKFSYPVSIFEFVCYSRPGDGNLDTRYFYLYGSSDGSSWTYLTVLTSGISIKDPLVYQGNPYQWFAVYPVTLANVLSTVTTHNFGVSETVGQTTLTFESAQGFSCFREGDVVQSDWNQSQDWSANAVTTGNNGNWLNLTNLFDGNLSTYAHANNIGDACTVTQTFKPPINVTSGFTVYGGVSNGGGGTIQLNSEPAQSLTTIAGIPNGSESTTVAFTGQLSQVTIVKTATGVEGVYLFGYQADNRLLVDPSITDPNEVKIVSIDDSDPGPYTITVDGGAWQGTDDVPADQNRDQVWSQTPYFIDNGHADYSAGLGGGNRTNVFNGQYPVNEDDCNLPVAGAGHYHSMNFGTLFSTAKSVKIVGISGGTDENRLKINGDDKSPASQVGAVNEYTFDITGTGLQSIDWGYFRQGHYFYMGLIYVDGRLLVDQDGDTKLVKETPYDTKLTVQTTKDIDNPAFSGDVFMTDDNGDGPFTQTPYKLVSDEIVKVESFSGSGDGLEYNDPSWDNWTTIWDRSNYNFVNGIEPDRPMGVYGYLQLTTYTFEGDGIPVNSNFRFFSRRTYLGSNDTGQQWDSYVACNGPGGTVNNKSQVEKNEWTTGTASAVGGYIKTISTFTNSGNGGNWFYCLEVDGVRINTGPNGPNILTLSGPTDLAYFRVGDVVQGEGYFGDWLAQFSAIGGTLTTPENAFNGNFVEDAAGSINKDSASVTAYGATMIVDFTSGGKLPSGTVEILGYPKNFYYSSGTQTLTVNDTNTYPMNASTTGWLPIAEDGASITTLKIVGGGGTFPIIQAIRINGEVLVDPSTRTDIFKVISTSNPGDSDHPRMTVDGGSWHGIDVDGTETGDPDGDTEVTYQTNGGEGNVVKVSGTNVYLNDTGDRDNRWIADNQGNIPFYIGTPSEITGESLDKDDVNFISWNGSPETIEFSAIPSGSVNLVKRHWYLRESSTLDGLLTSRFSKYTENIDVSEGKNPGPWTQNVPRLKYDTFYEVVCQYEDNEGQMVPPNVSLNSGVTIGNRFKVAKRTGDYYPVSDHITNINSYDGTLTFAGSGELAGMEGMMVMVTDPTDDTEAPVPASYTPVSDEIVSVIDRTLAVKVANTETDVGNDYPQVTDGDWSTTGYFPGATPVYYQITPGIDIPAGSGVYVYYTHQNNNSQTWEGGANGVVTIPARNFGKNNPSGYVKVFQGPGVLHQVYSKRNGDPNYINDLIISKDNNAIGYPVYNANMSSWISSPDRAYFRQFQNTTVHLTLSGDTDLAYFREGDVVQDNSSFDDIGGDEVIPYPENREWSAPEFRWGRFNSSAEQYYEEVFDGDVTTHGNGPKNIGGEKAGFYIDPPIENVVRVRASSRAGANNGGNFLVEINGIEEKVTRGGSQGILKEVWSGDPSTLTSIGGQRDNNGQGGSFTAWAVTIRKDGVDTEYVLVNGKFRNLVKIISNDYPDSNKLTVDGGSWHGIDVDGTETGDTVSGDREVTGPAKSGIAIAVTWDASTLTGITLTDSNHEWIDDKNRLGQKFYMAQVGKKYIGTLFYNANEYRLMNESEILSSYGKKGPVPELGIYELSETLRGSVLGFKKVDGKAEPVYDLVPLVKDLQTRLGL